MLVHSYSVVCIEYHALTKSQGKENIFFENHKRFGNIIGKKVYKIGISFLQLGRDEVSFARKEIYGLYGKTIIFLFPIHPLSPLL